jgi:hypothetical protein
MDLLKIGIIHNPNSKLNRKTKRFNIASLEKIAKKYKNSARCIIESTQSIGELPYVIGELKKYGVDIVGINGGDGTAVHVFTGFINAYFDDIQHLPIFCPFRGGTMNNLAWCNGLKRGDPLQIFEKLLSACTRGKEIKSTERNLIHVHDLDHNNDYYGTIFAGSPGVVTFLREYYKSEFPGFIDAFRILKDVLLSEEVRKKYTELLQANVRIDGKDLGQKEFLCIFASVIPRIADFLNIFSYMYDEKNKGKMHMISCSSNVNEAKKYIITVGSNSAINYLCDVLGINFMRGFLNAMRPKENNVYTDRCVKEIEMTSNSGIKYVIDSEFLPETNRIKITADALIRIPRFDN